MPAERTLKLEALRPLKGEPVSLEVPAGCVCFVRGPSGAGKSLLLRAVADLDPNEGEVFLGELARSRMPAHRWRRRVGYLPAESHWWSDRVGDHQSRWPPALLEGVGFGPEVLDWEVARLSTGERQRLALVRLLANGPEALLLDEPAANLDAGNVDRVLAVLDRYREERRTPVLWVSHGKERPGTDCIGTLRLRQGRVEALELPWR